MTWYIGLVILGILAWVALPAQYSALGQGVWLSQYRAQVDRGRSPEEAIFQTLSLLRYRAPFSVLTDTDIRYFASIMSMCIEPERFTEPLMHFQQSGDIRIFRDPEHLRGFVAFFNREHPEQPPA